MTINPERFSDSTFLHDDETYGINQTENLVHITAEDFLSRFLQLAIGVYPQQATAPAEGSEKACRWLMATGLSYGDICLGYDEIGSNQRATLLQ